MQYREVPKNGDKLSVLGYGCMRLPVRMQSINQKLAEKQIMYAIEQGVNYFDVSFPERRTGYGQANNGIHVRGMRTVS
jgi:predicted aldo/keto reductase-like oxidoreductase